MRTFSWTSPNDLTDDPEKSYIANRNPPQFIPKCVVCKGVAIENFLIGLLYFDGPRTLQQGWTIALSTCARAHMHTSTLTAKTEAAATQANATKSTVTEETEL